MADSKSALSSMKLVPCEKKKKRKRKRKMEMSSDTCIFSNHLTEGILTEILIRLPNCRAAIRCKLVCKTWFSLISSHYFASSFIQHRKQRKSVDFSMLFHYLDPNSIVTYSDFGLSRKRRVVNLSFLPPPPEQIHVEASFADLFLCSYKDNLLSATIYYICHRLTRQWVALPPTISSSIASVGFLCDPLPCSCTTVCSHKAQYKYLVVRILSGGHVAHTCQFEVEIFSSEQVKWTKLVVTSPRKLRLCFTDKTRLLAYERKLHIVDTDGHSIIVYDPFRDPTRFSRIIDIPYVIGVQGFYYVCGLEVCRGRLRIGQLINKFVPHTESFLCIWELEDYDMGTWLLVHKSFLKKLLRALLNVKLMPNSIFHVLGFHPNHKDVVYFCVASHVVRYNMRKEKLERSILPSRQRQKKRASRGTRCYACINAFQLVHLCWPTPVPTIPLISEPSIDV